MTDSHIADLGLVVYLGLLHGSEGFERIVESAGEQGRLIFGTQGMRRQASRVGTGTHIQQGTDTVEVGK